MRRVRSALVPCPDTYKPSKEYALLIAAAPDLLAACEAIIEADELTPGNDDEGWIDHMAIAVAKARSAIAKVYEHEFKEEKR